MAFTQLRHFDVTIPAGTLKASPLVSSAQFNTSIVERIEWLFPAGCQGLVGIQIGARNIPVIPYDRTQFLTRTGDSAGVDLTDMHQTGDWSVIGYNTGSFQHTIHVTFHTHAIEAKQDDPFILDVVSELLGIGEG